MKPIKYARAFGGLLSVAALLAILVAHTVFPNVTAPPWVVSLMLSLIAALLGVDIAWEQMPDVQLSTGENQGDNE
jgi:protein-S-isoprenylcysteine O-methyltransferase Ste14